MLSNEQMSRATEYNLKQFKAGKFQNLPEMFIMWLPEDASLVTTDNMGAFTWAALLFQIPQLDLANDAMCGPKTVARINLYFKIEDESGTEFPICGKGFWLWRDYQFVPEVKKHKSGTKLEAAIHARAEEYQQGGIKHVLLKVADDCWAMNDPLWEPLPRIFNEYGIVVVPWIYVWNYSDRDFAGFRAKVPSHDKSFGTVSTWQGAMDREAEIHLDLLDKIGGNFLIVNAEKGAKYLRARGGKTDPDPEKQTVPTYKDQIQRYMTNLKDAGAVTAVSTYGLPRNQVRHFPLVEMMEMANWGMPQWYWDVKGRSPTDIVEDGEAEWRLYTDKPLIPSGGCWQEREKEEDDDGERPWKEHWHTGPEITEYLDLMKARNCPWVSFWREIGPTERNSRITEGERDAIYNYEW